MNLISSAGAPKITVGLPVYNGEKYLGRALSALIGQDERDLEIIICDNCSTDGTEQISRLFADQDERIRYIRNDVNIGAGPNFNKVLREARGKYFKWAAHDDWISPDYLSSCVMALEGSPTAVLAYGATQCVDGDERPIDSLGVELPDMSDMSAPERFETIITRSIPCFEIFGVFRSAALARSDLHQGYYGSDRALLAQVALMGPLLKVSGPVLFNRSHPDRSIQIARSRDRNAWQDPARKVGMPLPTWRLIGHFLSIVRRSASPDQRWACTRIVVGWSTKRYTVFRLALEVVDAWSPRLSGVLENAASGLWRKCRTLSTGRQMSARQRS